MADYRRTAPQDSDYGDMPDRENTQEIRDEMEDEDDEFEDEDDSDDDSDDEEDQDTDLGKNVLDQERGAAASHGFTAEVGDEGGSYGETEVEREPGRRRTNAGEATTTGGDPSHDRRFGHRRDE